MAPAGAYLQLILDYTPLAASLAGWPAGLGLLLFGLGAGVGSAVNATVREIGGARGVAAIGSVASTTYSSTLYADLARVRGRSGLGPHYQPSTTANPTT